MTIETLVMMTILQIKMLIVTIVLILTIDGAFSTGSDLTLKRYPATHTRVRGFLPWAGGNPVQAAQVDKKIKRRRDSGLLKKTRVERLER